MAEMRSSIKYHLFIDLLKESKSKAFAFFLIAIINFFVFNHYHLENDFFLYVCYFCVACVGFFSPPLGLATILSSTVCLDFLSTQYGYGYLQAKMGLILYFMVITHIIYFNKKIIAPPALILGLTILFSIFTIKVWMIGNLTFSDIFYYASNVGKLKFSVQELKREVQ